MPYAPVGERVCTEQGVRASPSSLLKALVEPQGRDQGHSSGKRGVVEPGASRQLWDQKAEPGGSIGPPLVVPRRVLALLAAR